MINGFGGITRDFCPVANIVQANLLAAAHPDRPGAGDVFNVALGGSTTLSELYELISTRVAARTGRPIIPIRTGPARPGDIIHSSADISRIRQTLGFEPGTSVAAGLDEAVAWYASA